MPLGRRNGMPMDYKWSSSSSKCSVKFGREELVTDRYTFDTGRRLEQAAEFHFAFSLSGCNRRLSQLFCNVRRFEGLVKAVQIQIPP